VASHHHAAATLAVAGTPEGKMLRELQRMRSNLEAKPFGADVATAMAEAFVTAVAGHKHEMMEQPARRGRRDCSKMPVMKARPQEWDWPEEPRRRRPDVPATKPRPRQRTYDSPFPPPRTGWLSPLATRLADAYFAFVIGTIKAIVALILRGVVAACGGFCGFCSRCRVITDHLTFSTQLS
jgi:hypothetical protein